MPRTSNKAQLILEFVNTFVQENGFAPSVREIGAAVGLRSTASVSYHLQQLQEKGQLVLGTASGYPPFEFVSMENNGEVIGIDVELAQAIADKLGLELVIDDMEFEFEDEDSEFVRPEPMETESAGAEPVQEKMAAKEEEIFEEE